MLQCNKIPSYRSVHHPTPPTPTSFYLCLIPCIKRRHLSSFIMKVSKVGFGHWCGCRPSEGGLLLPFFLLLYRKRTSALALRACFFPGISDRFSSRWWILKILAEIPCFTTGIEGLLKCQTFPNVVNQSFEIPPIERAFQNSTSTGILNKRRWDSGLQWSLLFSIVSPW